MDSSLVIGIVFFVVVVIPSLTIHEYAHARASVRLGDVTPKLQGRLTLNPLAHIDPVGTIVLPLVLSLMGAGVIGRAKPVPINPHAYRKPILGEFLVAMAGPLVNIVLGIVGVIIMIIIRKNTADVSVLGTSGSMLVQRLKMGAFTNFMLAFFNLLPIPPLDGYRIITLIAPQSRDRILKYQQRISYALILVMITPSLRGYITGFVVSLSEGLYRLVFALFVRI